ncbi:MAG: glycoside hydrolase family 5 protein [Phycisphaerae bacterium]|jgi:endoglucanase
MTRTIKLFVIITLTMAACMTSAELNAKQDDARAFEVNKHFGRGINIGNALDAPREGEWGVTIKEEYFKIIKDAGFDSVRLPCRWSNHALKEAPYTIDEAFFKRVDWAVNNALKNNLYVMLNMHHYVELYKDPLPEKERFMALWTQIAEHYKDYPDTLTLEIFNEPDDAFTPELWNEWLKEAHAIIRKANPTKTIVIGPANDNWTTFLKLLELPEDDRNIIVTVHYYFPHDFTHQGAEWMTHEKLMQNLVDKKRVGQPLPAWASDDWEGDSNTFLGTKWMGTDEEKKYMTDIFDIGVAWGKKHNRPLNLGEFGVYEKADVASRVRWTTFIVETAVERGMSFHYWEFCANFGAYDPYKKAWREPLLNALIPPKK